MEVSGPNPAYHRQFHEGIQLFEKSFEKMKTAGFDEKKEQYVLVMKESLDVMQKAANAMLNDHLVSMKNQLQRDFDNYLSQPNQTHEKQVLHDINQLKNV